MLCKNLLLFTLLSFATLHAIAQHNTVVEGKLAGLKAGTVVYLSSFGASGRTDSVVAGHGTFRFNLRVGEGDIYLMAIGKDPGVQGRTLIFYLQPGRLHINGLVHLLKEASFSGSIYAADLNSLEKFRRTETSVKAAADLNKAMNTAYAAKDTTLYKKLKEKYKMLDSLNAIRYMAWVEKHPASPVSAMVLSFYVQQRDMVKLEKAINKLSQYARNNALYKKLKYSVEVSKATAAGKLAPGFTQKDTLGRPVTLESFKGRYVLIDFWASWCAPCRKENPNLVKAYQDFKDKNFTILGVSLDTSKGKDKWLKAIHDDGLTWTQVSDLNYWDNAVAKQYNIRSIPSNILVGPDGVILAKDLYGAALENKLEEILK